MRLIDADKFIEELDTFGMAMSEFSNIDIIEMIKEAPTVEERKHGHWVDYPHGSGAHCSCCKFKIRYKDKKRFRLCPECGAIMDEVSENVQNDI